MLAVAGIERMGLEEEITEIISTDIMLPAPGQGIIAIESRLDDKGTTEILREINHSETEVQATAERAFLYRLGGDCNVPVGCHATLDGEMLNLRGIISSPDGKIIIKRATVGPRDEARQLGVKLADMIIEDGGAKILEDLAHS